MVMWPLLGYEKTFQANENRFPHARDKMYFLWPGVHAPSSGLVWLLEESGMCSGGRMAPLQPPLNTPHFLPRLGLEPATLQLLSHVLKTAAVSRLFQCNYYKKKKKTLVLQG